MGLIHLPGDGCRPDDWARLLSPRERRVGELAGCGHANKYIALELGLSVSTIASTLACVIAKLGLRTRTDLAWATGRSLPAGLTVAECDVARAVLRGLSNQQIGAVRGTSARTVANQLAGIYRKLGLASRHELVALIAAL